MLCVRARVCVCVCLSVCLSVCVRAAQMAFEDAGAFVATACVANVTFALAVERSVVSLVAAEILRRKKWDDGLALVRRKQAVVVKELLTLQQLVRSPQDPALLEVGVVVVCRRRRRCRRCRRCRHRHRRRRRRRCRSSDVAAVIVPSLHR